MILEQKVKVKWMSNTKNHYVEKGYQFTKVEDLFEVDVNDLSKGSHVLVEFVCDYCNGENQTEEKYKWNRYRNLMNNKKQHKKDRCIPCRSSSAGKKFKKEGSLLIVNPNLAKEWNYDKNEKSPDEYMAKSGENVWWKCEKGHEWNESIVNRSKGNCNCPYCSNKKVCLDNCLSTIAPNIAKEWHPSKNRKITPFDIVATTKKKYWWVCSEDVTHEWKASPANRVKYGSGCHICNESKGEKMIRNILLEKKINFIPQYEFKDLLGVGGGKLKFDFAIFNKTDNLTFMIEYDGIFHYEKQYENDGYEELIEHDKRKNIYCKDHNIPLLRIPYWDFDNIEEILYRELTKYNL